MANIVEKNLLIDYIQRQEGDYAVIGYAESIKFSPKAGQAPKAHYWFPSNAFAKEDIRSMDGTIAIVICKKENLSKDVQNDIDGIKSNKTLEDMFKKE